MTPTLEFSVQSYSTGYKCQLLRNQKPLPLELGGGELLGAWQVHDKYLLLINDANGYEDHVNAHLLDAQMQVIESVGIGAMYSTGAVENIEIQGPKQIGFTFPTGGQRWQLTVSPTPLWRNPLTAWFQCQWWLTPGFKRYLGIRMLPSHPNLVRQRTSGIST
jgi:hypothetical protein